MTIVISAIPAEAPLNPQQHSVGDMWCVFMKLTFSGSYTTGGDAFDPTPYFTQGVGQILQVDMNGIAGYGYEYDATNKKLKLFSAANTELAAGAYNAALTSDTNANCQVFGK